MANSQLTPVNGSGTQTSTQNPQDINSTSVLGGQQVGNFQTSIQGKQLEQQSGGVPLYSLPLPSVDLNQTLSTTGSTTAPVNHKGPNPVLLTVSGLLLVAAVVLFYMTSKSEKNTTN